MTIPPMVLAGGSIPAGSLGLPVVTGLPNLLEGFLEPVLEPAHHALEGVFRAQELGPSAEWVLMGASIAVALIGIFAGRNFYKVRPRIPEVLPAPFARTHRSL